MLTISYWESLPKLQQRFAALYSIIMYLWIIPQKSDIFLWKTTKLKKYLPFKGYMAWFPSPKEEYLLAAASWLDPEWDKSIPNTQTTFDITFTLHLFFAFWCDCCISWPLALIITILELNINARCLLHRFMAKLDTIQSNCYNCFSLHSNQEKSKFRLQSKVVLVCFQSTFRS